MLSNLKAFFWGSPSTSALIENSVESVVNKSVPQEGLNDGGRMNDVMSDPRLSPESLLTLSSLSDEEADWVFVHKKVESTASDKESEPQELDSSIVTSIFRERSQRETRQRRPNRDPQPPATRSFRSIPSSALAASSALNALAVIRPQQKAQRRQRELRLKHKQLERSNLALHVSSSSNRPSKRKSRYSPDVCSRAVNNRKC